MSAYLEVRETHCAGVVLVGDTALKFKKPVDLGFLDFRSGEARSNACRREVELNRRFAPDVYRGLAELRMPDGSHEPVVVMRRMPADRRMSHLVTVGADVREDLRTLARTLAVVHGSGERRAEVDAEASLDRLSARWEQSFNQARAHHGPFLQSDLLDEAQRLTRRFLAGRRPLFEARVAAGCAVDGHGDLLADDVFCLADGPRALDCLEFDDRLRYVDRLDDACVLAMDLEPLGAPELGAAFVDWYAEFAGEPAPPSLAHHYIAYRGFVRAKVACLRAEQRAESGPEVDDYLAVVRRHLRAGAVTLTLVGAHQGRARPPSAPAWRIVSAWCCSAPTESARNWPASIPRFVRPPPTAAASIPQSTLGARTTSFCVALRRSWAWENPWWWTRPGRGPVTGVRRARSRPARTAT